MRLTSVDALASRQAPNRNPSDDVALVSCSVPLGGYECDFWKPRGYQMPAHTGASMFGTTWD